MKPFVHFAPETVEGKTISAVHCDRHTLLLRFADGSFSIVKPEESDYPDGVASLHYPPVFDRNDVSREAMTALHLATAEELEEMYQREVATWRAEQEAKEHAEYERLKAKYEGGT